MTITPKLHLMEDHIMPWVQRRKLGMGFHSEQGAESIHAIFNSLKRTYSGIRNPVDRLRYMLKENCLQNAPLNITAKPAAKKRKRMIPQSPTPEHLTTLSCVLTRACSKQATIPVIPNSPPAPVWLLPTFTGSNQVKKKNQHSILYTTLYYHAPAA